jgi:hypothetical protein
MTDTATDSAPTCSAFVTDAGRKRHKRCQQPVAFRWETFDRKPPGARGTPLTHGFACAMHRETAPIPDDWEQTEATWRKHFEVRMALYRTGAP